MLKISLLSRLVMILAVVFGIQASCSLPVLESRFGQAAEGQPPECLVGSWEVIDLQRAMAESFERTNYPLQFQSAQGRAFYEISEGGIFRITFDQLAVTLQGVADDHELTVLQQIEGSATARYSIDENEEQLVLTDFGGEGIQFSLEINGQLLMEGDLPLWRAFGSSMTNEVSGPTHLVEYSRVSYQCAGDEMIIQPLDPVAGPEVRLRRFEE